MGTPISRRGKKWFSACSDKTLIIIGLENPLGLYSEKQQRLALAELVSRGLITYTEIEHNIDYPSGRPDTNKVY